MLINCTPHAIVVLTENCVEYNSRTRSYNLVGEPEVLVEIAPSDLPLPRCTTQEVERDPLYGIPTFTVEYGEVENLPDPHPGVYFIVSALVANAARAQGRTDLFVPTRMVRNESGQIVGCLGLAR